MAIIDRRKIAMGGTDKRATSRITGIAVHYSATAEGNTKAFEGHWKRARGWNTGGYHEVVLLNGDVELNYNPDTISNGVYGHNSVVYNICYVGNGKPNARQLMALIERVEYNIKRFGLKASAAKGHREFSGQSTSCPALDMNGFRKSLGASKPAPTKPKPNPKPKPAQPSKPKAKLTVDGKWGNSTTRALQAYFGTPQDGFLSRQLRNGATNALYGSTVKYGTGGSMVVRELQKLVGVKVDGYLGTKTVRTLQKYLLTTQDGKLSRPSLVVKAMQRALNAGVL